MGPFVEGQDFHEAPVIMEYDAVAPRLVRMRQRREAGKHETPSPSKNIPTAPQIPSALRRKKTRLQ